MTGEILNNLHLCGFNPPMSAVNSDNRYLWVSHINLYRVDLRGFDLAGCHVCLQTNQCDLRGADFSDACLFGDESDIKGCDLRGANFNGAALGDAEFIGCCLTSDVLFRKDGSPRMDDWDTALFDDYSLMEWGEETP